MANLDNDERRPKIEAALYYIGYDNEKQYVDLAERRIKAYLQS